MPQRWDRFAIIAEVHRRGSTLVDLALENSLSESACRVALDRPVPSANRAIAEFLGVPLHELWPAWFDAEGNRRPGSGHPAPKRSLKSSGKRGAA